jgi:phage FluMu gp28-like protein
LTPVFKTERCQFLVENLNLPRATGVDDARWEYFQLAHLNDDGLFRIEDKSRQAAYSFTIAAEAVACAALDVQSSIFVSINLEEAKEKIRYARSVFENLEIGGLPRITRDNALGLEFDNGARLVSLPSRPPRGKPRMRVYLDEFAHVQRDREVYKAAVPVVTKGGVVRIGSSPLGASGVFWEIYSEAIQKYPGYTRKRTPWWEVQALCVNVREARRLAPAMESRARVELFGSDRIKAIYANMPEEDFRQEYEAEFVDETTAWISWEEIRANQDESLLCALATMKGSDPSAVFEAIEQLLEWVRTHHAELAFAAGVDIGRTRNATEIYLVGISPTGSFPLRLALTLEGVEFDDQEAVLKRVMQALPVVKMLIDRGGLGRQLAEEMEKSYPGKAEGVDFTVGTKQLWATQLKMRFQQKKMPIPVDRDMAYQIHSIKRKVTASKNLVFDTERNEKHHADKFWALALAEAAAEAPQGSSWTMA